VVRRALPHRGAQLPLYRSPPAGVFARWRTETPDDFVFAVKVSRVVSHERRLRDVAGPLGSLLDAAVALEAKLGPLLIQLPPQFTCDLDRLTTFLAVLPAGFRWVVETRHPSWQTAEVWEALARRGVALCVPVGGRVEPDLVTTAPFSYLRLHAGREAAGRFGDAELDGWTGRVRALARSGKDVFLYFNNDREGHAVMDARRALDRLRRPR
jgi:uncharacterized protein YecE (DUF72 family)